MINIATKFLSVRVEGDLLEKLQYIAQYEDRSTNGEMQQLIRKRIREFEAEHGEISLGDIAKAKKTPM